MISIRGRCLRWVLVFAATGIIAMVDFDYLYGMIGDTSMDDTGSEIKNQTGNTNTDTNTNTNTTSKVLDESTRMIRLAQVAERQEGLGNCGIGNHPTSLRATLNELLLDIRNSAVVETTENGLFETLRFNFPAIDVFNQSRTHGGDEFVFTLSGSSNIIPNNNEANSSMTSITRALAFKTSALARDELDGTYSAHITIPAISHFEKMHLSLMHYYTCWEGFLDAQATREHAVDEFGPIEVPTLSLLEMTVLHHGQDDHRHAAADAWLDQYHTNVPSCAASQQGMDDMSRGLWMELQKDAVKQKQANTTISVLADWYPYACQINATAIATHPGKQTIRVGDSTMPGNKLKVGNVYTHHKGYDSFREQWVTFLHSRLATTSTSDVLIFTAGLHPLFQAHFNAYATTELVLRMTCQLAAKFPGKLVVQGPVPIQQHLFHKLDITDQRVQLVNALLRQRIQDVHGRLPDLCQGIPVELFDAFPDINGTLLAPNDTQVAFDEVRPNRNISREQLELQQDFVKFYHPHRPISDGDSVRRDDRIVWFVSLDNYLRPRAECYQDKVHDIRRMPDGGGTLYFGRHSQFIQQLVNHRAMSKDP